MKTIKRIIRNVGQHWVGDGFPVRSLFSYAEGKDYDPFLLLDYAGPYHFAAAKTHRGVGEHPHRGFETVTIIYQGELSHRDSSGSISSIGPGDVQWMTAASGVVHEEFHSDRFTREGGILEMVQLWVNLPARFKMSKPGYQSIQEAQIPQVPLANGAGNVRVIAGEFQGTKGPAKTFTPINAWDMHLAEKGTADISFPAGHTAMFIVQSGSVLVNDTPLKSVELALFEREGTTVRLQADSSSRILGLSGEPINEPIFGQGPFVMNSREEIAQAIRDYQMGQMGELA